MPHSEQPSSSSCPHEDRIESLIKGQESLAASLESNTVTTKKNADTNTKVLALLQGDDPLSHPGQGMVFQLRAIAAALKEADLPQMKGDLAMLKSERDERIKVLKKAAGIAYTGASAAVIGLIATFKEWFKTHWN